MIKALWLACFFFFLVAQAEIQQQNGAVTDSDLIQAILDSHNAMRARVNPPRSPLSWNPALARQSGNVALGLGGSCNLQHSGGSCGENLASGTANSGLKAAFIDSVRRWTDEGTPGSCTGGGHYTQVIWGSTTEVGCGFSRCSGNSIVFACQYNPRGNWNQNRGGSACRDVTPLPGPCVPFANGGGGGGGSNNPAPAPRQLPVPDFPQPNKPSPQTDRPTSGCSDLTNPNFIFNHETASCPDVKRLGWCNRVGSKFCKDTCGRCFSSANAGETATESNGDSASASSDGVEAGHYTPGWAVALLVLGSIIIVLLLVGIVLVVTRKSSERV